MNKRWHQKHLMPKGATVAQRIAWHVEHQKVCGCRPIPASLRAQMESALRRAAQPAFIEIGTLPDDFDVMGAFLPKRAERVLVYLLPINMRSGPEKLKAIIQATLSIEPRLADAYVFTNKARDQLIVYWHDSDGEQLMQQKLHEGRFDLPFVAEGLPWASIAASKLRKLARV